MDLQTAQKQARRVVRVGAAGELLDWVVAVPAVLALSAWVATLAGTPWAGVAAYFGLVIVGSVLRLVVDLWRIRRGTSPFLELDQPEDSDPPLSVVRDASGGEPR